MARKVAVVPHTHWDREWYAPFPAFRARLVDLLDTLLPHLEADPSYSRFMLDGQMAVVDDYLEVRPEADEVLRRLASQGRLSLGPWYVLMDEFCVSGETIVRNLLAGVDRAASLGGAMQVGYLPDMFGHIAQMPQILAAAGIRHAVVWRGVPGAVGRSAFWWSAPDGSTVRAEYLPVGYANGAATPPDAAALLRRLRAHEAEVAGFLGSETQPILWMNGTDHQFPQPWLPRVLDEANQAQGDFRLGICSLADYLQGAPTEGLPAWSGELRSGARANLLMGVLSNRVDIKAAAAVAERALERRAEPLAALWLQGGADPGRGAGTAPDMSGALLEGAWRRVILNSAHDSICACSADAVGLAVLERFAQAAATADTVASRAIHAAGAAMAARGPVVVNASHRTRSGIVELVLSGDGAVAGTQLIDRQPGGCLTKTGVGADLARLLGELIDEGWLAASGAPDAVAVRAGAGGVSIELAVGRGSPTSPGAAPAMAEAWAQAGAMRDRPLEVTVRRKPSARVASLVADVPGYGWQAWRPGPLGAAPVTAGPYWLDNGLVRVEVDGAGGTLTLNGLAGFDRLVDGGDAGDTYNYSPPAQDEVVDTPVSVSVEVTERGPVRGRLQVERLYRWPSRLSGGRRVGSEEVCVRSTVELGAGEAFVKVSTAFDNRCRDHRLRAVFPLPERARESVAECAFATVTRSLSAEGSLNERGLATFPSRRFVSAGGLTVTHEGLLEYEVVQEGSALALTLLRCTGFLSRAAPAWRPNAAGPVIPLEGPQMIGPVAVRYALAPGDADPYALADAVWLPLEVVQATGAGSEAARGTRLAVRGAEVSALRRVPGGVEMRVFNPSEAPAAVDVGGRSGWLVDLRGRPLQPFSGSFPLPPWGIATARIEP